MAAADQRFQHTAVGIKQLSTEQPLIVNPEPGTTTLQCLLTSTATAEQLQVYSLVNSQSIDEGQSIDESDWVRHATATIYAANSAADPAVTDINPLAMLQGQCTMPIETEVEAVEQVWYDPTSEEPQVLGQWQIPDHAKSYFWSPPLFDACCQLLVSVWSTNGSSTVASPPSGRYVAIDVDHLAVLGPLQTRSADMEPCPSPIRV